LKTKQKKTTSIDPNYIPPPDDGKNVVSSTSLTKKNSTDKKSKNSSDSSSSSSSSSELSSSPSDNSSSESSDNESSNNKNNNKTVNKKRKSKEQDNNNENNNIVNKKNKKPNLTSPNKVLKPVVAIPIDPNMVIIPETVEPTNLRRSGRSRRPPPRLVNENKSINIQDKENNENFEENENQSVTANRIETSSTKQGSESIDQASMELIRKLQAEDATNKNTTPSRQTRRSKLSTSSTRRRKANSTIVIDEPTSSVNSYPSSSLATLPSPLKKRNKVNQKKIIV